MMNLQEVLNARGIKKVLVVDDCIDEIPLANDLVGVEDAWANFHDDWNEDIEAVISTAYFGELEEPFQLRQDDTYIAALWTKQNELGENIRPLFEDYNSKQRHDLKSVNALEGYLADLGLTSERRGRDFVDAALEADLIVIDLFLGAAQDDDASKLSKDRLRETVEQRQADMPPVLLFSNSSRLTENRGAYRDEAQLLESGFRILRKDELETPAPLLRQLERLAERQDETKLLARFFYALNRSMEQAAQDTLTKMRGLGLSDLAQIRQLLLEFEGRPMGGYLVDVFDRVLQHEIESQSEIIDAAIELNRFDRTNSGPPYIASPMRFQEVVKRMTAQAPERLPLGGSGDFPLTFGDVLFRAANEMQDALADAALEEAESGVSGDTSTVDAESSYPTVAQVETGDLLLVVTAACDLARGDAESILLLKGKAKPISEDNWLYKGVRSPALDIGGNLYRVDWNLLQYETMPLAAATTLYREESLIRIARLREQHALEIQQKLLSSLGRVGLPAHLPAVLPLDVRAFYYSDKLELTPLDTPDIQSESMCFVGRDAKSNQVARVVLSETGCDQLIGQLDNVDQNLVAPNAKNSIEVLKSTNSLYEILEHGIELKGLKPGHKEPCKVNTKHGELPLVTVVWNGEPLPANVTKNDALAKGLVLTVGSRESGF